MSASRVMARAMGGAAALSLVALAPALAATTVSAAKRGAVSVSLGSGIGSFTPAAGNPRMAASLSRSGLSGGSGFRFTPSSAPGTRRAVTIAVRARATTPAEAERTNVAATSAITPSAYNLGVSVGWSRFALSGDISRVRGSLLPGDREGAELGLSYSGKRWSSRLQVAADRPAGEQPRLVENDEAVSVDLGGSYRITRNLDVTGGVRYRMQNERLAPVDDVRRDSQAVYLGTVFRF